MFRNIQELESHIPSEKNITNYKIKPKEENNTNCSMEYMGVGTDLPDVF